jgi:hypothetical protein
MSDPRLQRKHATVVSHVDELRRDGGDVVGVGDQSGHEIACVTPGSLEAIAALSAAVRPVATGMRL